MCELEREGGVVDAVAETGEQEANPLHDHLVCRLAVVPPRRGDEVEGAVEQVPVGAQREGSTAVAVDALGRLDSCEVAGFGVVVDLPAVRLDGVEDRGRGGIAGDAGGHHAGQHGRLLEGVQLDEQGGLVGDGQAEVDDGGDIADADESGCCGAVRAVEDDHRSVAALGDGDGAQCGAVVLVCDLLHAALVDALLALHAGVDGELVDADHLEGRLREV